jgi:hypothetical protein
MVDWDSSTNDYKPDNTLQSFIFSIDKKYIIKLTDPTNTIYCNSSYGLTYGGGHDLYISDKSNINQNSYSNIGHTYKKGL